MAHPVDETTSPPAAALRDGTPVRLRPIAPRDKDLLTEFHGRLSASSVYFRYFMPKPELSPADLAFFTEIDHHCHEALVATVEEDGSERILGVGRYLNAATTEGGMTAEVAFIVADAWQGRGVGTLLLSHLASRARAAGIRRLEAWVLPNNRHMLDVFARSGLARQQAVEDGVVHVVLDLEAAPAAVG